MSLLSSNHPVLPPSWQAESIFYPFSYPPIEAREVLSLRGNTIKKMKLFFGILYFLLSGSLLLQYGASPVSTAPSGHPQVSLQHSIGLSWNPLHFLPKLWLPLLTALSTSNFVTLLVYS